MFSSRRVAVTTISSSGPVEVALASAGPVASVAPAAPAAIAAAPLAVHKSHRRRDMIRWFGFGRLAGIIPPAICYMVR
jgi:hypothetical protein